MRLRFIPVKRLLGPIRDERGAALVFFGLMFLALMACFSIAVDAGLWVNTGSEAQRTADSAALAGAAEFRAATPEPSVIAPIAEIRAREFAGMNFVGRTRVNGDDEDQVAVEVRPAERWVGVTVRGSASPLFARLLGFTELRVERFAAARVVPAGGATCVKPFAIPDQWKRGGGQSQLYDPNDPADSWVYNPGNGDTYRPWDGGNVNDPDGTGYGTRLRDGLTNSWSTTPFERDNGRRVLIKAASTQGGQNNTNVEVPTNVHPGVFLPIVLDGATPSANCGLGGDGGVQGAGAFSRNICACNSATVSIGDSLQIKTGNMVNASNKGVEDLIALENRPLQWRPNNGGEVYDTRFPESVITDSPRFIRVILYDPDEITKPGKQWVNVRNLATIYVEGFQCQQPGQGGGWTTNCGNNPQKHVVGRFMYYGQGSGEGTNEGSLLRNLQLVR